MKGTVVAVNQERCAIQVGNGITICAIFGPHSTGVGDELSGALERRGCEMLRNYTKGEEIRVMIEDCNCSAECARHILDE